MYRDLSAEELAARLGTNDVPLVLDVRERDEFATWSIPGALNIPIGELEAKIGELPHGREVVTVCASGSRSSAAAAALARAGWHVANLAGGMPAWGAVYDSVTLELAGVTVVQVRRRGKGCLSYLIGADGEAFVIDPSLALDLYRELAAEHEWRIARVFDTHLHADHVSGARALAEAVGASLHLNPADDFAFAYERLADGDRFELSGGEHFGVAALHTPGHTRGSTVYFVADRAVLTGDTLLVDGVGRPDLAERAVEFARNLYHSLKEKVLVLPEDALVLPAHYGDAVVVRPDEPVGARLATLRSQLAPLSLPEEEFVAWATERSTPRPPNYAAIIRANAAGSELPPSVLSRLELGPNRCSA
jgi:glyoxylase-like metal-dependent hydrolase (beta-lactamase superfamily II)